MAQRLFYIKGCPFEEGKFTEEKFTFHNKYNEKKEWCNTISGSRKIVNQEPIRNEGCRCLASMKRGEKDIELSFSGGVFRPDPPFDTGLSANDYNCVGILHGSTNEDDDAITAHFNPIKNYKKL